MNTKFPLWLDGRWHLEGRGIHAGDLMEIRWPDGTWEVVRIESGDGGTKLFAHFDYHGHMCCIRLDVTLHQLRWRKR